MKNFLFSLCAVAPLLIHSNNRGLAFESEDSDSSYSIVVETRDADNEKADRELFSLEAVELAQIPSKQESKEAVAEALIEPISQAAPLKNDKCSDPTLCLPDIEPYQVNVRHTESNGIGYNNGYTTLEGFFTHTIGEYIPFFDLRGHVFDNGRLAANAGMGARYVLNSSKSMVGINTFYDYRGLKHAHFNQWGVGLECFYNRWELRINGYLPLGKKKVVFDHHLNGISFKNFQGNNLWINENYTDKSVFAMKGCDFEAGVHPFKIMRDYDCLIAAGPYYFEGEGKSAWGGKIRLKVELAKYLFLELSNSFDKVFHNRFQGTVSLSLPFGGKKCYPKKTSNTGASECFADNIMAWRGVQPVHRQEIIVAKKRTKSYTLDPIAIDPATKQPIFITFVNNQSSSSGSGTFETPYSTVQDALTNTGPGSVIYVFAGDGTAYTSDGSFTLQDKQRFLGSAAAHTFNTTLGAVTVPIQTQLFPLLTPYRGLISINSSVQNIEVSGISMQQLGNLPTLSLKGTHITLTNNIFKGVAADLATVLVASSGSALIDNNIAFGNTSNTGIRVLKYGSSEDDIIVSNNVCFGNDTGIFISYQAGVLGTMRATITGNTVSNNTSNGLAFIENHQPVITIATVSGNTCYNNGTGTSGGNGILFNALGTARLDVFDNTTIYNGLGTIATGSGIKFQPTASAESYCVSLHDNVAYGNATAGYSFANEVNASLFTEPLVNNVGSIVMTGTAPVQEPACFCQFCVLPATD